MSDRAGDDDRPTVLPGGYPLRSSRPRKSPRPLSGALRSLRSQAAPPTLLAAVQQTWPEIAGPAMAAESEPVSEREGVVTIACTSAVWASELTMMAAQLVERLNEGLPPPTQVDSLRFSTRSAGA